MWHEIINTDTLGIRTDGIPPVVLTDGDRIVGQVQPAPACYATPTASGATAELWPEVSVQHPAPAHRFQFSTPAYAMNSGDRTVEASVTWADLSVAAAARRVEREIDRRWDQAMNGGAPVVVPNGGTEIAALVRYEERDRSRYAGVHDPAKVPDPGLVVIAVEPPAGFDRTRFVIGGVTKIAAVLDQTLAHRNLGDLAWNTGYDDVAAIVEETAPPPPGGWDDEAKVAALAAYDVEALAWPPNEVPVV